MNILKLLVISLVSLLAPIEGMVIAAVALTIADLMFGLLAALKQKLPITSRELKRTPIKLVVYLSGLILSFIAQKYMIHDMLPLTNLMSTLIGATELKSILEALDILYGQPFFSAIINNLANKVNQK